MYMSTHSRDDVAHLPERVIVPCVAMVSAARPWSHVEVEFWSMADSKKAPLGRLFTLVGRAGFEPATN
ncbi:hypothetical protein SB30_140143 [Klebsiella quasipneumoniae subsp. similipneumoniae]|nr:hypothetical protein SB30_140143 [Klebsiella quasipneumoniae subsp. similipneumoniae]